MFILFLLILFVVFVLFFKIKFELNIYIINFNYKFNISILYFKKQIKGKNLLKNKKPNTNIRLFKKLLKYIKIDELSININSGLIDVVLTSIFVSILASIISIIFLHLKIPCNKRIKYSVIPVYDRLLFDAKLHCIFSVRIVNIIYILISLFIERRNNNGRTSARKSYEYCYE